MLINNVITNWYIDRTNDHNRLTPPEIKSRSRKLKKHTTCMISSKYELAVLSPLQLFQWRSSHSPDPPDSNVSRLISIGSHMREIDSRRLNNEGELKSSLKTVHVILLNLCRDIDDDMLQVWTNRANFLNNKELCMSIVDNDQVHYN